MSSTASGHGPFDLTGRVALITGGSRGIGAATVRLAADRGWTVCFSYLRQAEEAEALARA